MSLAAASRFACGERAERIWMSAARNVEALTVGAVIVALSWSRGEQQIEFAGPVKRVKLVAAADVPGADENLRGGRVPVRPVDHFRPPLAIAGHVDLAECDPLALKKFFRPIAIGAIGPSVSDDVCHGEPLLKDNVGRRGTIWACRAPMKICGVVACPF